MKTYPEYEKLAAPAGRRQALHASGQDDAIDRLTAFDDCDDEPVPTIFASFRELLWSLVVFAYWITLFSWR